MHAPNRFHYIPSRVFVSDKIAMDGWTQESVAGRVRILYPDNVPVCHETIYQICLYHQTLHRLFVRVHVPRTP
jgi:hypothetical protein